MDLIQAIVEEPFICISFIFFCCGVVDISVFICFQVCHSHWKCYDNRLFQQCPAWLGFDFCYLVYTLVKIIKEDFSIYIGISC